MLVGKNLCLAIQDPIFGPKEVYICMKLVQKNNKNQITTTKIVENLTTKLNFNETPAQSSKTILRPFFIRNFF